MKSRNTAIYRGFAVFQLNGRLYGEIAQLKPDSVNWTGSASISAEHFDLLRVRRDADGRHPRVAGAPARGDDEEQTAERDRWGRVSRYSHPRTMNNRPVSVARGRSGHTRTPRSSAAHITSRPTPPSRRRTSQTRIIIGHYSARS